MSEDLPQREELERRIRMEAQRFDLRPSDMVWQNINRKLHPDGFFRKPLLWVVTLLLLAGSTSGTYYYFANRHHPLTIAVKAGPSRHLSAPGSPAALLPVFSTRVPRHILNGLAGKNNIQLPASDVKKVLVRGKTYGITSMANQPLASINHARALPLFAELKALPEAAMKISLKGSELDTSDQILASTLTGEMAAVRKNFFIWQLFSHTLKWDFFVAPSISFRWINYPAYSGVTYFYYQQSPFLTTPGGQGSNGNLSKNHLYQYSEFSFAAGVHVHRNLGTHFNLTTGLEMDRFGYGIQAVPVSPTLVLQAGSGTGSGTTSFYNSSYAVPPGTSYTLNSSGETNINNTYYFVTLPLLVGYHVSLHKDWKLNFSGGMDLGYLVYQQSNILSPYTKVYYSDNSLIRKWEPDLNTSIYFSIPFTRGTYLQIGPEFRYQVLSTYINYSVKEHPYSLGIRLGIGKR
ncbi:MAG TPA: outer membrane beta-barrel protein [Chitinophagaceae bacterium]|nr:outer membrane beta-barrel protein [Chitinophagaceae bacterium]